MERFIFILLLTIAGSMGMGIFNNCDTKQCDHLLPKDILEKAKRILPDEEDLKILCPPLLDVTNCTSDLVVQCTEQTIEELATSEDKTVSQYATFVLNLMKLNYEMCDEESDLHKNYVASAPCYREMISNLDESCINDANNFYGVYRGSLPEPDEEEDTEKVMAEANCMIKAYQMACGLMQLEKSCGEVAKDTVLQILKKLQFLKLGFCSEGDLLTLKTKFLDFLEEQGEQRDFLTSAFDFRRKK